MKEIFEIVDLIEYVCYIHIIRELHIFYQNKMTQLFSKSTLIATYINVALVVSAYWVISILTVFVNKDLLSSERINLDAPLFVTWYQCIVSTLICFSMSKLSLLLPQFISFPEGSPISYTVMCKILPLSILFTGMIAFNSVCLKYVGVAFYYIGRSLTTVFNVVLTYLILGQKTTTMTLFLAIICLADIWYQVVEALGSLSVLGTVYGVLGSFCLSMYSIYANQLLQFVKQDIWLLSYYNNFYSSVIFIPLIAINGEIPVLLKYDKFGTVEFWLLMTVGGLCGFANGLITLLQIKVTSPLTHNISGTAKESAQNVISSQFFQKNKPTLWWVTNCVILGVSATYLKVKQQELKKNIAVKKKRSTSK
ncbi:hypothetical protein B566_EDAN001019 [Ephemera danica]|nr:hypothetical protein B566_EDAN001019 [Ephemera danica]